MTYRGIPGMEVHLYRWGEIRRELRGAGYWIDEVIPLEDVSYQQIRRPGLLPSIRARGLDRVCEEAMTRPTRDRLKRRKAVLVPESENRGLGNPPESS